MSHLNIGVAQLGPIQRDDSRSRVVSRLINLLEQAHARGCEVVVYPELALTTFFPRWWLDEAERRPFYETQMPSAEVKPLFERAAALGVGFFLGFAEQTPEGARYNSAILVGRDGREVGRYRKVHLPGHADHEPWRPFQHLEKGYFSPGERFEVWSAFGGRIGMMLCNDRRWPESYRLLGLQQADLVLLGYNTPTHNPPAPEHDRLSHFHNHLVMQAGAYQNGCWVAAAAKAGTEEGVHMIGGSCIIAPSGEIAALAYSEDDELISARCDLALGLSYRRTLFNFAQHRRPEVYEGLARVASPLSHKERGEK